RRGNDAEPRAAGAEEREVDREFVATGNEFASAIEGIDQHEVSGKVCRRGGTDRLFRYGGDTRKHAGETFEDPRFSDMIGKRDRRTVPFELRIERARAGGKHRGRRARNDSGEFLQQPIFAAADRVGPSHAWRSLCICWPSDLAARAGE